MKLLFLKKMLQDTALKHHTNILKMMALFIQKRSWLPGMLLLERQLHPSSSLRLKTSAFSQRRKRAQLSDRKRREQLMRSSSLLITTATRLSKCALAIYACLNLETNSLRHTDRRELLVCLLIQEIFHLLHEA